MSFTFGLSIRRELRRLYSATNVRHQRKLTPALICILLAQGACTAWAVEPVPSGCGPVGDTNLSTLPAVLFSPPAAIRDLLEIVIRTPYPMLGAVDPGHPWNYVFAPFVALAYAHGYLFFGGTELDSEGPPLQRLFDPGRCGWTLGPSLHALW